MNKKIFKQSTILLWIILLIGGISLSADEKEQKCAVCHHWFTPDTGVGISGYQSYQLQRLDDVTDGITGYYCQDPRCQAVRKNLKAKAAQKRAAQQRAQAKAEAAQQKYESLRNPLLASLANYCKSAAKQNTSLQEQLPVINQKLKQALKLMQPHREMYLFWTTVAQYASADVIKYYWPDPADQNVYLAAKKLRERNHALNKHRTEAAMASYEKNGRSAFALGKNPDGAVRFVDTERFSTTILEALYENQRLEQLQYMIKQCGGDSEEVQRIIVRKIARQALQNELNRCMIEKNIAKKKQQLTHAEDALDKAKAEKEIAYLNARSAKYNMAFNRKMIEEVFARLTPYECCLYKSELDKYLKEYDKSRIYSIGMKEDISHEEIDVIVRKAALQVFKAFYLASKKQNGETAKWFEWRFKTEKSSGWKKGIQDPWLPMYVSDIFTNRSFYSEDKLPEDARIDWRWQHKIAFPQKPGYVSGSTEGTWDWCPGQQHLTRFGYAAAEKEGEFSWKAGLPHPQKVGMLSGPQKDQWVAAPGFVVKNGSAAWTAGQPDPARPGLVSAEKIFTWMPDEKHLWKNPKDANDLTVREDYQELNTWGKIALLPLVILLGVR